MPTDLTANIGPLRTTLLFSITRHGQERIGGRQTWWLSGLALLSEKPAKPEGPALPNRGRPRRSRATMTASTPARPTRPTPNSCVHEDGQGRLFLFGRAGV